MTLEAVELGLAWKPANEPALRTADSPRPRSAAPDQPEAVEQRGPDRAACRRRRCQRATAAASLLESGLAGAAHRGSLLAARLPASAAACGSPPQVECLSKLAGNGVAFFGSAKLSGTTALYQLRAVDGNGVAAGPVSFTIDTFFQSTAVASEAMAMLTEQLSRTVAATDDVPEVVAGPSGGAAAAKETGQQEQPALIILRCEVGASVCEVVYDEANATPNNLSGGVPQVYARLNHSHGPIFVTGPWSRLEGSQIVRLAWRLRRRRGKSAGAEEKEVAIRSTRRVREVGGERALGFLGVGPSPCSEPNRVPNLHDSRRAQQAQSETTASE